MGDFQDAFAALLGKDAPNLSPGNCPAPQQVGGKKTAVAGQTVRSGLRDQPRLNTIEVPVEKRH